MNGKNIFRQKFTRIEGLSSIRRLPRLGKIRLGVKKVSAKGKEYPSETDYFVCPAEVMHVCGKKPTELKISFPINDPEVIFPQCYKWYGSSKGLKCRGDGETALRLNEETGEMEERNCPCELLENGKCKQRASLLFNLLDVGIGGVYQIDLSSYHSIVDINSGIDYARALLSDRIAFVPFLLKRVPKETHADGKKQIHYTLQLELNLTAKQLLKYQEGQRLFNGQDRQLEIEAPKEDKNPAYDSKEDGAVIEEDDGFDEDTDREIEERVGEEGLADIRKEKQEALEKELEASKKQQAKLKKEIEAGKHNIKTPAEIKAKLEERNAILDNITKVAKENNLLNWRDIIEIGERYKIFPAGLVTSQVKTIMVDHPEKLEALLEVIKSDQEITVEDLPRDGKLELRESKQGLLEDDEETAKEEEPGSSYDNPIKFEGKRKEAATVEEDFISG